MSDLEDRMKALDARIAARASELESRFATRFGGDPMRGTGTHAEAGSPATSAEGRARSASTPPSRAPGVRRGLFIGLGDYDQTKFPGVEHLRSCVADARALAEACRSAGGWQDVRTLFDKDATLSGIRSAVRTLANDARPGELALLFISTHGGCQPGPKEDDAFLLAYDDCYAETDLLADVKRFRRGVQLLVVVNACHAAGLFEKSVNEKDFARKFTDGIASLGRSAEKVPKAESIRVADIASIASSARDQTSIGYGDDSRCGEFLSEFLQEGWLRGAADGFAESIVSVHGPGAIRSADAVCEVKDHALPKPCGRISFLDMVLYSVWKLKDISLVHFEDGPEKGRHIPQFFNHELLQRICVGPAGSRHSSGVGKSSGPSQASLVQRNGVLRETSASRYGLFIGLNESFAGPLQGCVNDATQFRQACIELGGWSAENAILLVDKEATKGAVRSAMRALAERARPGDDFVFFYSGHGGIDEWRVRKDDDFLFCLHDQPYGEGEFREDIDAFRRGVKRISLVDACFADGVCPDGRTSFADRDMGWIVSATSRQTSADCFQGRRDNGFFTGALLDGWLRGGAAGFSDQMKSFSPDVYRSRFCRSSAGIPETVTFLDLAVFASHSWRYFHPDDQNPQYHNDALLASVVAGRAGVST